MLPVAVAPSPKSHWKVEMVPVEEVALKFTESGAGPARVSAVMIAFNSVVPVVVLVAV